jgi:hypothetical protein
MRWNRKVVELRPMVAYAIPVGLLSGAGVAALEAVCNRVLWAHLGSMNVTVRVIWPIVGLVTAAYVLHRLRLRTVGMLNEVVVHYHAPIVRPLSLDDRDDPSGLRRKSGARGRRRDASLRRASRAPYPLRWVAV